MKTLAVYPADELTGQPPNSLEGCCQRTFEHSKKGGLLGCPRMIASATSKSDIQLSSG